MASKNQNKPPTPASPSNSKCLVDEVSVDKRRKIGFSKMVGPANGSRTRQAFSVVNGGQDLAPTNGTASNAGSDCGSVEFTREEVEGLLIEKMKTKNKFNLKEKCDQMMEYIKRLRLCIKWFQELEGSYLLEQEKLRNLLEMAEKKCSDMEMLMKAKEEELNSIIMELRKNYSSWQEKFMKEESDRLAAVDSLAKEKEAKVAAERMQASLLEELRSAQRENSSANQKISSLNDMYKRLQEYNTSLQQYNSKLQSELATTNETLKRVEKEKAAVVENLSTLRGHYKSLQDQLTSSRVYSFLSVCYSLAS